MKLAFLPGKLLLNGPEEGVYTVTVAGQVSLQTRSKNRAVSKFNEIRQQMEPAFPARSPTPEEKSKILQKEIGDSLVGHNSLGGRKKKTTAGSTRTFGG